MSRQVPCSALAGVTAGLFPLALLIVGFMISMRQPAAAHGPMTDSAAPAAWTAEPLVSQDPVRIGFARREYHAWSHAYAGLARARTLQERRQDAHQEEITRLGYYFCYQEVTPAARERAHLPAPDGE